MNNTALKNCHEMEQLRNELYKMVNGERKLHAQDVCEVSTKLDKLIVKHMGLMIKNKEKNISNECS
ncbi:MAG: aspartyl-phosphate phosphatase Spo0E family protein [Syntrophomonadaceae bacterium]